MKIRSITYFCNPGWPLDDAKLRMAGDFLNQAKTAYEAAGYEIQTTRLATTPFSQELGLRIEETPHLAEAVEGMLKEIGVAYASLGPAFPHIPGSYQIIPEALAHSQNIFFSGLMADTRNGIFLEAVHACAEVIVRAANITPDGFANLRFAALANVLPGAPFFPAAYWDSEEPAFALATEAADLAVDAFTGSKTIEEGRTALIASIEKHARQLTHVAGSLECKFGGIDLSLAPFPEEGKSLGTAFERMGVPAVGLHGSLAAAAILTEAIDRADFPRCGFSGLMMPVLEDAVLAKRAAEGTLSIKDLLLYSAVCGTGLDTIPLPGDVTIDDVAAVLLDLSTLAVRLDKPLTARLMPIPGKKAGDPTDFDFSYFANSRVMALESEPLGSSLSAKETFHLKARRAA